MDPESLDVQEIRNEREIRAARNEALFRSVNEKMLSLNNAVASITETFVIACECADISCIEMLDIRPEEYEQVRRNPRHFAVLPGHVCPDVERTIAEFDGYTVVGKTAEAGVIAEQTATRE